MSRIREKSTKFIIKELKSKGVEGIVPSHGDILYLLFQGEKYTMKQIADKIHRTKPTVTVLIEKLVECGFVQKEKCGKDSRVTYVKLTKKGIALKPIFFNISDNINTIIYGDFTEEETEIFERLLNKINSRFDTQL